MSQLLQRLAFLFLAMMLSSCGKSADPSLAEQAIPAFHQQYNDRQFRAIYAAAADGLKEASSEKEMTAFMEGMHRKLGVTETTTPQSKHVTYGTSGTVVVLVYRTKYVKGEATEHFTYVIDGDTATLLGYHVTSNAFVIN